MTLLGSDAVLVGLTAIIYWCFDKRRGRLATYILFLGAYLNFFLKILIPWPRPPFELRIVGRDLVDYGFPSGHAQDSSTFWSWISLDFKKRSLAVLGTLIVLAVGISRVYLGVHYPGQVIGGWLIGFAVAALGMLVLRRLPAQDRGLRSSRQMLFAFTTLIPLMISVGLGAVGDVNAGLVGGYLFAFSLGAIVEDRYVGLMTEISWSKKILRTLIGIGIVGLLVLAMSRILPMSSVTSSFVNSSIRGLAVSLIAPAVFKLIEKK